MSTPNKSSGPSNLVSRIESLEASLLQSKEEQTRRCKLYFGVGVVLLTLAAFSLTSLTRLSSRLDAAAVAQLGRLAVEENLPQSMASLEHYLKSQSGHVVRNVLESALEGLPLLRTALVQNVDRRLRLISNELETQLTEQMENSLRASREAIDLQGDDLTGNEKLELMLNEVVSKFRTNSRLVFHEIYPQYVSEIGRVEAFVADLQSKSPSELTPRERTQKEMIETLLRIMTREKYLPAGRTATN